jgi:hypothetical protein
VDLATAGSILYSAIQRRDRARDSASCTVQAWSECPRCSEYSIFEDFTVLYAGLGGVRANYGFGGCCTSGVMRWLGVLEELNAVRREGKKHLARSNKCVEECMCQFGLVFSQAV